MEIIRTSREDIQEDKVEMYRLTRSRTISAQTLGDSTITVKDWILYRDKNLKGEEVEILAISCPEYELPVATVSKSFKESFLEIIDMVCPHPEIMITQGISRGGRKYILCGLVRDSEN